MKGSEQGRADFPLLSQCGNFGTSVLESKTEQKQELGKGILWDGTSSVLAGCHKEKELLG